MCYVRAIKSHFIVLYDTIICSKFEFQRYTTYFWSWCNFYSKGCKRTMTFHTTIAQNEARERNSQVPNFHAIWGITKTSFPFSFFNLKSIYFFLFFQATSIWLKRIIEHHHRKFISGKGETGKFGKKWECWATRY